MEFQEDRFQLDEREMFDSELSFPAVDLTALEAMNSKGVKQRKTQGPFLLGRHKHIHRCHALFSALYLSSEMVCLSVDLLIVSQ